MHLLDTSERCLLEWLIDQLLFVMSLLLLCFTVTVQTCSLVSTYSNRHIVDKLMAETETKNTYLVILVPIKQYDHCYLVSIYYYESYELVFSLISQY